MRNAILNVPHSGHEAIFRYLIKKFDILVFESNIWNKKKNDFSDKIISIALNYMEKKYKNLLFLPVWSNFHYAGPKRSHSSYAPERVFGI